MRDWVCLMKNEIRDDIIQKSDKYDYDFLKDTPKILKNYRYIWRNNDCNSKVSHFKRSSTWTISETKDEKLMKNFSVTHIRVLI